MVSGFLAGLAGGAGITIVIQAVDKFSGVFANVNKAMLGAGVAVGALGIAGLAASKSFVDVAASFESAFTGVRKTVDLTEAEFEKLRLNFKDLSKEIPVTFQQLSSIGEIAGQLGVEGVDNITKFTKTIADISATTNLTAEQAATDFARFANIMNMPIDQIDRLGSVVVDLGNNFATSEAEIVSMGMRISGAGAALEMSEGQVMAWGAALSSVGVKAEMGGTAISKLMINISSMVSTGSEDLEGFAQVAGMTTDAFSKAFKEDASGALQTFFVGLGKVKEGGGDVLQTLEQLDIKEVRLRDAVLRLSGSHEILGEALAMQNKSWETNNALAKEAALRYGTTESQVIILKNKFNSLREDMGKHLIPAFITLITVLGDVIGWLEKHPTLTKFAIGALAIGSALAVLVAPFLILLAMLPAMITGFGLLSAVTLPITATIVAIAAAIMLVVAGIILFAKWMKKLKGDKEEDAKAEFARMNPSLVADRGIDLNDANNNGIINLNGGSKTPSNTINLNGDIYGTDPDNMADAFASKMDNVIRLN